GIGTGKIASCNRAARTNWVQFSRREPSPPNSSTSRWMRISGSQARTIPFKPGELPAMGAFTMGSHRLLPLVIILGICNLGWAQSPTFGLGRTPSAEEIRAWDISISPTGKELPPGRGTAKEGEALFRLKGCAGCHGATGIGARAPALVKGGPPA